MNREKVREKIMCLLFKFRKSGMGDTYDEEQADQILSIPEIAVRSELNQQWIEEIEKVAIIRKPFGEVNKNADEIVVIPIKSWQALKSKMEADYGKNK